MGTATQSRMRKLGQFFKRLRFFFSPKKNSVLQRVELNFTKPFFFNNKIFLIFGYVMSFSPPHPTPRILEGNFSFKMMMLMLVKQSNAL